MSIRYEYRLGIRASADAIWAALEDLPTWPSWNPMYAKASGKIGFGELLSITETIPGLGERELQPRVTTWTPLEQIVWAERRGLMSSSVRYFEIDQLDPKGGCIFANGEIFQGFLAERYARRHARALKAQFEAICEALRAKVEGA